MQATAIHRLPRSTRSGGLSKRERRAITLRLLTLLLVAAAMILAPRVVYTMSRSEAPATVEYVVVQGDTLWSIAAGFTPGGDPRRLIHAIKQSSGLRDAGIRPGMVLTIPVPRPK